MSVILVVDDDAATREALGSGLKKLGHEIHLAGTGAAALDEVRRHPVDLAIIDLKLPDMEGTELFGALRILRPEAIAIMISGAATVDEAVSALKRGIYDFITKDFRMGDLRKVVSKALETQQLLVENQRLREALKDRGPTGRIIGRGPAILKVLHLISQVAPMKSTALIEGESGVGKELIADAIHYQSPRRPKPLVKINCGALPEGLIESELFGHEKGSFTGAIQQRKGRFELADGGTIFLDEISEIPPATQVKLLRVLETKQFERVGDHRTVNVDVRIITATNRDLDQLVAEKKFREDFFFRINVIPIRLPALEERLEDVPLLVDFFIHQLHTKSGKDIRGLSPEAMKLFTSYHWPGNVRELKSAMEYAFVIAENGLIEPQHLPTHLMGARVVMQTRPGREDWAEKKALIEALRQCNGIRSHAAQLLGISRVTVWNRIRKYGIDLNSVVKER